VLDWYRAVRPLLWSLSPETAHHVAMWALRRGLTPKIHIDQPSLRSRVFGIDFPNPVGLAAGFDKSALAIDGLLGLGFGFVEIGTVTPRAQPGNHKPRLFRLVEDGAVINRMGFNNDGLESVATRLEARRGRPGIVGANLGKNKDGPDAIADYVTGARRLAPSADYLVVNVSSPNTPGLRALQAKDKLEALLSAVRRARDEAAPTAPPPLLVKIAPDLLPDERKDVAAVVRAERLDGIIVSNTTVARPDALKSRLATEAGGLSGRPLYAASTELVREMYRLTDAHVPIIGVGGIESGYDAYKKLRAGASLVQIYSGMIFAGPYLVERICTELAALLRRDKLGSVAEARGLDA
jgi:dihydroorotate dehydrogenase